MDFTITRFMIHENHFGIEPQCVHYCMKLLLHVPVPYFRNFREEFEICFHENNSQDYNV